MESMISQNLETYATDLINAIQVLMGQHQDPGLGLSHESFQLSPDANTARTVDRILSSMSQLQTFLFQLVPTNFLQQLASQSQLLACLQWLGEFQVLAYIPISGTCSVPIKDVADLADVPEAELCRVVRVMAMTGFLQEPQPGYIEHTRLSASFVNKPSLLDAAMFLAETAVPSALHMAAATKRHSAVVAGIPGAASHPEGGETSAHTLGLGGAADEHYTFPTAFCHSKRLQRQWPAYLGCVGDTDDCAAELLGRMDWSDLGNACVVDVGGSFPGKRQSGGGVVVALAELYPRLHFVVQMEEPPTSTSTLSPLQDGGGRISLMRRVCGTPQTIKDAAVYMVRLPNCVSPVLVPVRSRILHELRAHLRVLEANRLAMLILTPRVLPEPHTVDAHVESMARLRDLYRRQLVNDGDVTMQELMDLIDSVHDGNGRLVVIRKLHLADSAMVGLGIRYQTNTDRQHQLASLQ